MLNNLSEGLSTPTADTCAYAYAKATGVIYGVTAALSFLLNFLFTVIMIRKPAMLKRPHNILLFSLAITGPLTGWYLFFLELNTIALTFTFLDKLSVRLLL